MKTQCDKLDKDVYELKQPKEGNENTFTRKVTGELTLKRKETWGNYSNVMDRAIARHMQKLKREINM